MYPEYTDFSATVLDLGPEAIDRLEMERLRNVLSAKQPTSERLELGDEELLRRLNLLVADHSLHLTAAGLLLVGKEEALKRTIPGHEAIYLHMHNQTEYRRRLDTSKSLLSILQSMTQAVEPHNQVFTLKLGLFHFDIPDFPQEVYREALLNALVHRDYQRHGPVYLRHYPDRLEISSPGGFYGGVTAENLLGHEPVTRNRLLAEALQRIGLVERAGMGVKRMFQVMLSFGKEPPAYEATADFVRVNLRSGRTGSGAGIDETFARFVAQEQKEGRELGLSDLLILNFLKRNREIDTAEAKRILQRGESEALETLNSMVARQLLEPFGQKKGRIYRLSKRVYSSLRTCVDYQIFRRAEAAYAENTILAYLDEMPEGRQYVTNEIVRTLLRVNAHQAGYILSNLVKKKKLILRGRSRSARYYKNKQLTAF